MSRSQIVSKERLEQLFDAHHQRLYRLARRLCLDAEEARDLVQETYLRAARRPGSVPPGPGREEAWLVRVLVNLSRDRSRRLRVRERARRHVAPPPPASSPESAVVARDAVRKALRRLSPRRRAVVVLHHMEDLPVARVAELLGITQVTVRYHLSVARRRLAELLAPALRDGAEPSEINP